MNDGTFVPERTSAKLDLTSPKGHPLAPDAQCGVIQANLPTRECIIISDSWPSWLFVLAGHHLKCSALFLPSVEASWITVLQASFPLCQWFELTVHNMLQFLTPAIEVVFIQGSYFLSPDDLPLCLMDRHILWSLPPSLGQFASMKDQQLHLSHTQTGGILAGSWTFWSNTTFDVKEAKIIAASQRRLRHIINSASVGSARLYATPAPDNDHLMYDAVKWCIPKVLDWNGCFPAQAVTSSVQCKSVFTSTKWTIRSLTVKELGSVFDVPQQMVTTFSPNMPIQDLPFIHPSATPTKLLAAALTIWIGAVTPCMPVSSSPLILPNCTTDIHSTTLQIQEDYFHPGRVNRKESVFDKAVKSDDAQAVHELWDDRIWALRQHSKTSYLNFKSFLADKKKSPKTCPLSLIRMGLLCHWRRRVTRCLLRHLKTTFGEAWGATPAAQQDLAIGRECLVRVCGADWWEWWAGSTLFFW
jgi:hypothetical protein